MDSISQLYDFLAGTCLYITVPLCIAGLARKTVIIISGRFMGLRFQAAFKGGHTAGSFYPGDSGAPVIKHLRRDPLLVITGALFHVSIFAAPLTARAHGILLDQSWNIYPPRIDPVETSAFTATALAAGFILVLRRVFVKHVFAVSSWRDFAAMTCVLVPFLTGMLAGRAAVSYKAVMIIHIVSAHILLIAIGWTRLGHAVFFTAGRLALSGRLTVRSV